jgi:hypothetical protein
MALQDTIDGLKAQVATLTKANQDQQAREQAAKDLMSVKEAAEEAQVALLTQQLADLQVVINAGGLTPQQTQDLTDIGTGVQAVIDSINAEDPTPPVVPAP